MAERRPTLGAETEIALALITISGQMDPSVVPSYGSFTDITCTDDIDFNPPNEEDIAVPCGYNPVGLRIPGMSERGELRWSGKWIPEDEVEQTFNGQLCTARLRSYIDTELVAEFFCHYIRPKLEVNHPEGDNPATCRGSGAFDLLEVT